MKKILLTNILLLAVFAGQSQTKNFIDQPYIEVTGSADTLVTPNEIYIKIILSEKDTRDRVSLENLELKMVTVLKSLNLNTEIDLTTSDMISNFKFYLLKEKDVIKTKLYILKVKNAEIASKVFIKLEEIEISNTSIERIDHTDTENLKNIMRAKAITDAKTKATVLTKSIAQSVGPAIHIVDVENNNQQVEGRARAIQIRGVAKYKSNEDIVLPKIEFEKIKITSNISVKFVLK